MSISDCLDQIEARRAQANSSLNGRHMLVGKGVPEAGVSDWLPVDSDEGDGNA